MWGGGGACSWRVGVSRPARLPGQLVARAHCRGGLQARNKAVLDDAEAQFQSSDLLRTLRERSDANRDERKKELANIYCMRQAELGVGDCGGLRCVPGARNQGGRVGARGPGLRLLCQRGADERARTPTPPRPSTAVHSLIPGMTKSGVQKRPELLNKIFGLEEQ